MIPVGTPVRLINQPVKVAWVDGELLLEAHPPVDAEGQSFEPDVEQFAELLRAAVGDSTVAIHWDYAREVLQKADGVLATSASRPTSRHPIRPMRPMRHATSPPEPVAVRGPPGGPAAVPAPTPAATGGPAVAPGASAQPPGREAVAAGNIDR